jgi:hypothetical protein
MAGMKRILIPILAMAGAAAADMRSLPSSGDGWFGDPLIWRFRPEGIACAVSNGHGFALYEAAPLSSNVEVEAVFTPAAAQGGGWNIASVAIVDNASNFWHVALVQSPPEEGAHPRVELCEMREGRWLAQSNLRIESNESPKAAWGFGTPYRLALRLDPAGITGSVAAPDGTVLLRRRHAFSGPAVARGRPALRAGGIGGTFAGVRAAWGAPAPAPASVEPAFPPYASDRFVPEVTDTATGFFRVVQKPDGRWWAMDPLGRGLVLLGVDHVTFHGHWCEKLGYAPHGRKNEAKYAGREAWREETLGRLGAWGFTMLGAGCDPGLRHRGLVHTEFLNIGSHLASLGDEYDITPNEHRPCSAFPNVFHPDFEAFCRYRARTMCAPNRNDPWLLGTFIDNELAWWGRGAPDTGLFDAVMKKGATHTAKIALTGFVAARCDRRIEWFNATFGTKLADFKGLLVLDSLPNATPDQRELKKAFLVFVAERYFTVTSRAIREADPNHLVLGARFAGTGGAHPAVWEVSGRHCEVVTFNCYPMADLDEGRVYTRLGPGGEPVTGHFATYHGYVRRPMLITEWSFPALDAGLPSVHGAGQRFRTQRERTQATELFARTMLSLPFLIGYDYFMWVDEPALGITPAFPEDSNYGLINEDGRPYELLTSMFAALHRDAGALRFRPPPAARARPAARAPADPLDVAGRAVPPGASPAVFARNGDAFRAENGRLVLTGTAGSGPMLRAVTLDGAAQPHGRYNALLHTADATGRDLWTEAATVIAVDGRVTNGVAVVDVTSAAPGAADRTAFEVTHRILLPPAVPWFAAQVLRVRNTGGAPLRLRSLFFRFHADFRGLPDALPPNLWGAPVADAWLDEADGRFLGAVASRASGMRIDFWVDKTRGSTHPDARMEMEETVLAPGAVYEPAQPVYLLGVAGGGGTAGWTKAIGSLEALLR